VKYFRSGLLIISFSIMMLCSLISWVFLPLAAGVRWLAYDQNFKGRAGNPEVQQ
jgi:hypothetical protein